TEVELVGTGLDTLVNGQDAGYMKGPLDLGYGYSIVKVVDKKYLADSVNARHILIPFAGAASADPALTRTPNEAKALADSLLEHLNGHRGDFVSVSDAFSSDVVAKGKGGELGYFKRGAMARPFENFCYFNGKGKLGVVATQFGFHIVEILDQKGSNAAYKIGQITRQIMASDKTIQDIYGMASTYAAEAQSAEDYRALATEMELILRPGRNLGHFDEVVPGLGNARRVVRWAWEDDREEGNIGLIENDGKGYVVVILTNMLDEGTTPFEMVKDQCMEGAKKEAKKAIVQERMEAALSGTTNINELAATLGKEVRSLSFRISQFNVAGIGNEAEVVGTICGQEPGVLGDVLLGETGAFVALTSAATPAPVIDYKNQAANTQRSLRNLVSGQAYKALQDKATLEDKRWMMY
ncbi:MAG: hypothetical protein RLZZ599_214, partial [Bacteroidota bacterium]